MTSQPLFAEMSVEQQVESLADCLSEILEQYELGVCETESINHEFNSTFKVTAADGEFFALRINVNSNRSIENLKAEVFWVNSITDVMTPKPKANQLGEFVTLGWHEATGRKLSAVLYSWLAGEEPGDEPTLEQLGAAGAAMAKLHKSSVDLVLPAGAELPDLSDFHWGEKDYLLSRDSKVGEADKVRLSSAKAWIEESLTSLFESSNAPQPIHADLHPWNLMWHDGKIAVFDFDDCGMGLPVQDLAIAIYYLDSQEQIQEFLAGYQLIRELPLYTPKQMQALLLQRRIMLLNYLYETSNPEHSGMIPKYQAETFRRIEATIFV